jgi:hypothetical protein
MTVQVYQQQETDKGGAIKSGSVARGVALLVCATIFLLTSVLNVEGGYGTLLAVTICVMLLLWQFSQQSLGAVLIFSATSLYVVPLISLIYVGLPVNLGLFALFTITAYGMVLFGSRVETMTPSTTDETSAIANILAMTGMLVMGLVAATQTNTFGQPVFTGFVALALVHLERLHWARAGALLRWAALVIYAAVIGIYAALLWDGFGRIVIISFLLLPVLISARYKLFRLGPLLLMAAGGLLVFVGRVLRFGVSEGISGIAVDSGATHLILSSELLASTAKSTSGTSLFEQFQLFFLNWAPREVWPGKPININSLFVDSYIGRGGLSEEHSTALGFFGEQIYLAGDMWLLTALVAAIMTMAVRAFIARVAQPYYASVIAYDVWLVTLFWGGMASFAARAWFAVIPLVAYVLLLKNWEVRRRALAH